MTTATTPATPTVNIIALLHRAGQVADERYDDACGDITPRQQMVLAALAKLEEASQTRLVIATGIDRSTMADLARRMSRNGLIARRRSRRDARAYVVTLTEKGAAEARRATASAETVSDAMLASLPSSLRRPFVSALTRLTTPVAEAAE
jgi:DNA-binding MarR family transcriptional regulator